MFFRTIDIPTPPRPKPFQDKYLEALRAIASELNQIRMYLEKSEGIDMAKSKTKHRRGSGRPMGMTLADELARKRMIKQAVQEAADDATVQVRSDTATQKALWLAVCSIADAYGFGPERMQRFFEALEKNTEELEHMRKEVDDDYAYEKLRLKAEHVTGMEIKYLYEHEMAQAEEKHKKSGISFD